MFLTGRPEGPCLGAPGALVDLVERAAGVLSQRSAGRASIDGLALLGERAAIGHLARHGDVSCGGSTRLIRAADGWVAVALARPDDVAALPAWLGHEVPGDDPWPVISRVAGVTASATLDARAALLGLPFAALGSVTATRPREAGATQAPNTISSEAATTERMPTVFDLPVGAISLGPTDVPGRSIKGARVVDLSSLWAGPLCGQLLAQAGAEVVKVESLSRPDGARQGPEAFFDLLNAMKASVALDLTTEPGICDLRRLLRAADVVIESARPRALEQMGILAADVVAARHGPAVWVSITSHGRSPGSAQRVAFGDVAAVAGGLVVRDESGPCFLADAVADPLCGLVAAAAVLEALAAGGRWLLDAAMAPMAASVAGPPLLLQGAVPQPPRARAIERRAAPLGSDTATVLGRLSA
jgi:hypothetical protein